MKQSIVAVKAFAFSIAIIRFTKLLEKNYENIVIIKQILRCATSIGANIQEALGGNSRKEFIHSMNISKREARETKYWLEILCELYKQNEEISREVTILLHSCEEIINILTSIIKTSSK